MTDETPVQPDPPNEPAPPTETVPPESQPRTIHPAFRLVGFLVAQIVTGMIVYLLAMLLHLRSGSRNLDDQAPLPFVILSILVILQALAANAFPIVILEHRPFWTVGLRRHLSAVRDVVLGLVTGGLTPALVVAGFAIAGAATIKPVQVDWVGATIPMIVAMTLVSSTEELILRGYLMQVIAAMGGPIMASIISGGVFGLLHAGNPGANAAGLIITAVNGMLLAYLVVRTGSLWLACAYHAGWNLVAALGFGLRDSGMLSPGAIASTELHGSAFWTGGSYGFEASIVAFAVEFVILMALLKWAPKIAFDPEAQPYFAMKRPPVPAESSS